MRKVIDGIIGFVSSVILVVLLIGASVGVGFGFSLGIGTDKTESFRESLKGSWETRHGDICEEEES